ncbi:DNA glycosylase AlkZ-like family protein [Streptomyces sp. NPDC002911]
MEEAVRRVFALQVQTPASPYLALWNRVQDFAPEDLDAALEDLRRVIRHDSQRCEERISSGSRRPSGAAALLGLLPPVLCLVVRRWAGPVHRWRPPPP